jgi:hypothetical protein
MVAKINLVFIAIGLMFEKAMNMELVVLTNTVVAVVIVRGQTICSMEVEEARFAISGVVYRLFAEGGCGVKE